MDDPLGNPLMVEVGDFFSQNEVFEQCRPARSRLERILVIGNDDALICGQLARLRRSAADAARRRCRLCRIARTAKGWAWFAPFEISCRLMKRRSFSRQIVEVYVLRTAPEHFEHCLLAGSIARAHPKQHATARKLRVEKRRLILGQLAPE